jgi:hypothetical protein
MNTMESRIKTVLDIFEGNIKESDAALRHNVTESEIQEWKTFYTASIRHAINSQQWELPRKSGRKRVRVAAIIGALLILGTAAAVAGPADIIQCTDNDYFFCFSPNTPAKASEVNHNFAQMADWVEKAVGPIDAPALDSTVAGTTTVNGSLAAESADVAGTLSAGSAMIGNSGGTALTLFNDADIAGVDLIQGYNDLRFAGSSATSNDMVIADNGDVTIRTNLTVSGAVIGPVTVLGEAAGLATATATCPANKRVVFAIGYVNDFNNACNSLIRQTRCTSDTILTACSGQSSCAYTGGANGCGSPGNTCVYALCM